MGTKAEDQYLTPTAKFIEPPMEYGDGMAFSKLTKTDWKDRDIYVLSASRVPIKGYSYVSFVREYGKLTCPTNTRLKVSSNGILYAVRPKLQWATNTSALDVRACKSQFASNNRDGTDLHVHNCCSSAHVGGTIYRTSA